MDIMKEISVIVEKIGTLKSSLKTLENLGLADEKEKEKINEEIKCLEEKLKKLK